MKQDNIKHKEDQYFEVKKIKVRNLKILMI